MDDFIYKYGNKKFYKEFCSGCDRGYVQKKFISYQCASCSSKQKIAKFGNPMSGKVHKNRERFRKNTFANVNMILEENIRQ